MKRLMAVAGLLLALAGSIWAQKMPDILADADQWIISDTSRIKAFIDSSAQTAGKKLESSLFWDETRRDLAFLLGIDFVSSGQMDNTGRIYFLMRVTGEVPNLFYMDAPEGWPTQLSPNSWAEEGYTIWGFEVHPSGDYVLVQVMRYGSERHDIYKFNRDGTFQPLLVNPEVRYTNITFKNKDEFFLTADDRENQVFCKYTISTGKLDTIYQDPEWAGIYDYENGLLLCGRSFSFSENQLFTLDENTMQTRDLTKRGYFDNAFFTGDGRVILTTDAKSKKNEFTKLVAMPLDKPKNMQVIYDPRMENTGFEFVKETGTIYLTLNKDGYSELVGLRLDGSPVNVPKLPVGVLSGGGPYDENGEVSENGIFIFGFSSPSIPPSLFYFEPGDKDLTLLATVSTFGFDFSGVKVEVIHYPSKDGTMIPALLYTPADLKKDGANPAIVQYHGGPPAQWRPYFERNLAFALAKGFVILRPNVRGSTGYGPAWEKADNLNKRFSALGDAEAAIDYLVKEKYSTPSKIAIWGGSYGGYTVNYMSVTAPEKFACAISEVGVADHDFAQIHGDATGRKIWEEEFGKTGSKLAHDLSPIFKADNLTKPILVTSGFYDPRVFAGDPRRFAYLLSRLGKNVLYLEDVESGHGATTKEQVISDFTRYYVFLQDNILSPGNRE